MRQHVNPLSRFFQLNHDLPSLDELFHDSNLPIHLDIGCARGRFLLKMAGSFSKWNFLGIEIREPLVIAAEKERVQSGLNNLRFLFCNANVSLEKLFLNLRRSKVKRVSIQFPDPWFKKRHKKRRLMQPSLLFLLAANLDPGAELFIQTDVLSLMDEIIYLIDMSNCFNTISNLDESLNSYSPYCFVTEREEYCIQKGLPIYRKLYVRNSNDVTIDS
ncbi:MULTISPECIES: tRNA (guanosine(46)-N7)-methyltransferase TrmB [unclassified Prochlorococcus]|uniref:tRNA (guanosine(46)-N7)-methyltransferase TrmB n=1 Tax=unclassified Prochlorococcus TaxID=2627481 RepID=UPI0005336E7B|nr:MULTISPECIES: tRNA (guanosine(46)-N7)-methyltransferase TrmB [unclassified Prochlorococcus]KGG16691.1 tRNA (guanine46-N7-)-methyltransferase [Prochlorococcus sp. MIT 0602]KGG18337.1 tRNA (guanine46-N7-)-methyltransferase [Prochlorococcus sp. MIT 0603]